MSLQEDLCDQQRFVSACTANHYVKGFRFYVYKEFIYHVQSTLVISNIKGLSETLRDTRTSTYQSFRIEEK